MTTSGFQLKKRWWAASLVALLPLACLVCSGTITIQIATGTETGFVQLGEGWTLTRAMVINGVIVLAGLILLWEPLKQLRFTTFSNDGIRQIQGIRMVRIPWPDILVVFGVPAEGPETEPQDWRPIEVRDESGQRIRVNPVYYRHPEAVIACLKEHCPPRTHWRS